MIEVTAVTTQGGAVTLNEEHGVWASYAVATAGDPPPAEILIAGIKLQSGRHVQLTINRETGLVCLDRINPKGDGGTELFRQTVK